MPLDLLLDLPEHERTQTLSVSDFVRQTQERTADAYALAREHLRVATERRKASYDIKAKDVEFHVGDWVWYWYPRKYPSKSVKWQRSYTGPYLVIRKIEPVNVVLQRSRKAKPFVVHINKLKKCLGDTPPSWLISSGSGDTVPEVSDPVRSECVDGGAPRAPINAVGQDYPTVKRRRRPPQYLAHYYC